MTEVLAQSSEIKGGEALTPTSDVLQSEAIRKVYMALTYRRHGYVPLS
jgi:hypothetical protein